MVFPNDLLCLILDLFAEDRVALLKCCLVNWEFNHAASRVLYSQVVLQPRPSAIITQPPQLSRQEKLSCAILSSASLPRNAPHVKVLRIGGRLVCA
jgi:hypothetical protein